MTQSEIEMAKLKSNEKIANQREDREDVRARKKNIAGLLGGVIKAFPAGKLINSPDWYKQYDGLDGVNTSIPDYTVGDCRDESIRSGNKDGNSSVVAVRYYQTIGQASSSTGATATNPFNYGKYGEINTAISRIRANLGKRNSLAFTIGKDTFGRYMIACTDGLFGPMKRLKAALDVYTCANAFYPKLSEKLIHALGFDVVDFRLHEPDYRDAYNKWANKINESVPMIKSCTFLERRLFLHGLIIKDRDDARAQNIIFSAINDAYMVSSDDLVHYRPVHSGILYQYDNFFSMIDETFRVLTDGATWKQVIRLFLGGFDNAEFYQMPADPKVVTSIWAYSSEMLNQLHNIATLPAIYGSVDNYDGTALYQGYVIGDSLTIGGDSSENIIQGIAASGKTIPTKFANVIPQYGLVETARTSGSGSGDYAIAETAKRLAPFPREMLADTDLLFNTFSKPTGDDYLVGTRLSSLCGCAVTDAITITTTDNLALDGFSGTNATSAYYMFYFPLYFGTEVVSHLEFINESDLPTSSSAIPWDPSIPMWNLTGHSGGSETNEFRTIYGGNSNNAFAVICSTDALFSSIDWLPLYKRYRTTGVGNRNYFTFGELSHYTVIPASNLFKLHGQAILSEFSIKANKFLPPLK